MSGSGTRGLQPATPPARRGPRRTMPRQRRDPVGSAGGLAAPSRRNAALRVTLLWVVILVASSAGAWYFGSERAGTTDLSKKASPFAGADVATVRFTIGGAGAAFVRGDDGKFARVGAAPAPVPAATAVPAAGATPPVPTVAISPASRVESFANQLHDLSVDRVVSKTSSESAEYGLDKPVLVVELVAKAGGTASFAVGGKGVGDSTYYVRRDAGGASDVILVSKYGIDEIVKFATEQAAAP